MAINYIFGYVKGRISFSAPSEDSLANVPPNPDQIIPTQKVSDYEPESGNITVHEVQQSQKTDQPGIQPPSALLLSQARPEAS